MEKANPELRRVLIKAVKTQLKENNPSEVKQTYMRLLDEGIFEKEIYVYLAQALACEMYAMMKEQREFDINNYVKLLAKLPNLD